MDPEQQLLSLAGIKGIGSWLDIDIPLPIKRSSCIASATYNIGTGELKLSFVRGETVTYPNFDIITVISFVQADSPGHFYNSQIRGRE
jgi:KTSC domain